MMHRLYSSSYQKKYTGQKVEEIENAKECFKQDAEMLILQVKDLKIFQRILQHLKGKQERILEAVSSGNYAIEYSLANFVD